MAVEPKFAYVIVRTMDSEKVFAGTLSEYGEWRRMHGSAYVIVSEALRDKVWRVFVEPTKRSPRT